jgi:hypothetical protein
MTSTTMTPVESKYFTVTSSEHYDRHQYQLELNNGDKILFDSYDQVKTFWFKNLMSQSGCAITILDKKIKKKPSKGF